MHDQWDACSITDAAKSSTPVSECSCPWETANAPGLCSNASTVCRRQNQNPPELPAWVRQWRQVVQTTKKAKVRTRQARTRLQLLFPAKAAAQAQGGPRPQSTVRAGAAAPALGQPAKQRTAASAGAAAMPPKSAARFLPSRLLPLSRRWWCWKGRQSRSRPSPARTGSPQRCISLFAAFATPLLAVLACSPLAPEQIEPFVCLHPCLLSSCLLCVDCVGLCLAASPSPQACSVGFCCSQLSLSLSFHCVVKVTRFIGRVVGHKIQSLARQAQQLLNTNK